ncbi:MAG: Na+-transporting NADH:ubiquinone oxidoreductase subunit A [Planctomycetota bacterium]|jgi:Na+-transporting NADH:ubiquinone oxidoreductase subunit A
MTTHKIKKGLDLPLAGRAEFVLADAAEPTEVGLETAEFVGIKPKVLVKEGDSVQTGQPIFLNKLDRDIVWSSPVTGKVKSVEFGARRHLCRVVIENDAAKAGGADSYVDLPAASGDRESVVKAVKGAGLWPLLRQRPVGKMPMGDAVPVAIFVNGMDTAPLAADPVFASQGRKEDLQAGIDLLKQLTSGTVYLSLRAAGDHQSDVRSLSGVEVHDFSGPHPSGLVGTHISEIQPLKSGEIVYVLSLVDVARLGQWQRTGKYPAHTVVAVSGSDAPDRKYFRVRQNATVSTLTGGNALTGDHRLINGDVLNGYVVEPAGYLGLGNKTLTVMPEGTDKRDLFGWAVPQFGKMTNHASVNFGLKKKEYVVDARLNGGQRPIVNIGSWEKVLPLDILPTYLVRAIQANDIEEALKLGLLEVTEEDVALCTFVDPCKIDVGEIIRQGLDMYEKEA